MDDQLTAALAERAWTEPEWGNDGTDWVSSCGSYWARGEAGFSSVRWYLREDMSIEARTATLSEALTQLDLLTPATLIQVAERQPADKRAAPAPGEMQYRANKLLGELIEQMLGPRRVSPHLQELIEWLDYTMGTNVSDPEPARLLQESTLQPLDEESDPVRIYDVAQTALQLRYGEGLSWARAIFSALEVGGGTRLSRPAATQQTCGRLSNTLSTEEDPQHCPAEHVPRSCFLLCCTVAAGNTRAAL